MHYTPSNRITELYNVIIYHYLSYPLVSMSLCDMKRSVSTPFRLSYRNHNSLANVGGGPSGRPCVTHHIFGMGNPLNRRELILNRHSNARIHGAEFIYCN